MMMVVSAVRRINYLQSTAGVPIVPATAAQPPYLRQVIVPYQAQLAAQKHGYTQIFEESVCQFRLLDMVLGIMLSQH